MKRTKVIASVGPASNCIEVMSEMVNNGMDCARINLSHATEEDILKIIDVVRKVRKICNKPIAIMYDTKGPEFRTLKFKDGGVSLKKGETIKMSKTCILGNENEFGVNHSEAIDFIKLGNKVLIDNALLELEVIEKKEDYVVLKALGKGDIKDHKTINVPGVDLKLDFISEVDEKDIAFAATHACDYLALSFVTAKEDVIAARKIIEEAGGDALIISKIESNKGIENIDDIIDVSDGIMVARGDLGVEVAMERLPMLQKEIIKTSMYENPRPTRAEVSDVANAILDGTDCVMLSGETTVGKYPIESVEIMSRICKYVESTIDYTNHTSYKGTIGISDTIAKLVIAAAEYSDIKLIVTPTMSGFTARKISNFRPNPLILALCPSSHIAEKVVLNFGVKAIVTDVFENMGEMSKKAKEIAKKEFNLNKGDIIVITGGFPLGESKRTNSIKIVEI